MYFRVCRDNIQWDPEQEKEALKKVKENSDKKFSEEERNNFEINADKYWEAFYSIHQNKFFKDRNWLFTEFPELDVDKLSSESKTKILEIGCGAGNTIFPILQNISSKNIFLYGCDFSKSAIKLVKEHPLYDEARCFAFECDITLDNWSAPFKENSLDIVTMIFVLSAISPDK